MTQFKMVQLCPVVYYVVSAVYPLDCRFVINETPNKGRPMERSCSARDRKCMFSPEQPMECSGALPKLCRSRKGCSVNEGRNFGCVFETKDLLLVFSETFALCHERKIRVLVSKSLTMPGSSTLSGALEQQ